MATLIAHLKVLPGKEAEFEQMAKKLRENTVKEPSCRRYEYYRRAEPGHYFCFESYDDFDGFVAHQTSSHPEFGPLRSFIETARIEWIDPVPGAGTFGPSNPPPDTTKATERNRVALEKYAFEIGWWRAHR
jgi:quinol monooxygenase YgiN